MLLWQPVSSAGAAGCEEILAQRYPVSKTVSRVGIIVWRQHIASPYPNACRIPRMLIKIDGLSSPFVSLEDSF